ncbi:hypothetical protein [Kitasatospora sp. NPDC059673]|uniref:hypothetical protein n=1 Tax=Kitasatospora sp. NPDC059673 TaxID=3346901 RepID=UPI00368E21E3
MRKNAFRRATAALLGAAAIALTAPATTASAYPYPTVVRLNSGETLMAGQTLRDGSSVLVMQGDGNLVLYLEGPNGTRLTALWSTGTYGNPGAYAFMQPDGNLVVYKQGSTADANALWSTRSWNNPGAVLSMSGGFMTVWSPKNGSRQWESRTGLAPAYGFDNPHPESCLTSGKNIEPGQWIESNSVWLVDQPDGNLVLYRKRDGAALWSTGTWNHPRASLTLINSPSFPALWLLQENTEWSWVTPVNGRSGIYAVVQDDGNFVIYTSDKQALWSTGTWGNN